MRIPVLRLLLVALLLIVASHYLPRGGSHTRPRQAPSLEPFVRDLLYADLQTWNAGPYWQPLTISRVGFETRASRVVPGLVYHWASYTSEWIIPPFRHYSLAGEREGRLFLVMNTTTWSILAHGWAPSDTRGAIEGCVELLGALAGEGPEHGPVPLEERAAADSALEDDERSRVWQRVTEPTSVRPPSGASPRWEVLLWVVQRGPDRQVTRFRCTFPESMTRSGEGAQVAAVDSIPLMQFPLQ